jgi:uncharacterized protein (TIGR02147 family)
MLRVYSYIDYRDVLQGAANERKKLNNNFKYGDLAITIGVQAPYLSRVFNKSAHLSSDQVHLACEEFKFSIEEIYYIFLLLEYQKSGLAKRRESLKVHIKRIQEENLNTKKHLKSQIIEEDQSQRLQEYYLEPLAPLIHSFLHIPRYQIEPRLISVALGCPEQKIKKIISSLEKLAMVQYNSQQKKYIALNSFLHLDKKSTLNEAFQIMSRALCNDHMRHMRPEEKHQYTVTITTDEITRKGIYEDFNNFIRLVEERVKKSKSTGVYQLSFDLFRWDACVEGRYS